MILILPQCGSQSHPRPFHLARTALTFFPPLVGLGSKAKTFDGLGAGVEDGLASLIEVFASSTSSILIGDNREPLPNGVDVAGVGDLLLVLAIGVI